MPNIEARNEIMLTLYNAILQADEDYANTAHLLLTRYQEEYIEEEAQIMEAPFMEVAKEAILPPELNEIVKDPDVTNLVKQYKKTDEQYTVEKSLVDLDEVIEKPELEVEDKIEKIDELKDVAAKLIANGASNSLGVVQEIGEKIVELKVDIQGLDEMQRELDSIKKVKQMSAPKKTTKRKKRRRSY